MSAEPEPRQRRKRRAAAAAAAENDPEPPPSPPGAQLPDHRKAPTKRRLSEEDEVLLLRSFLEITNDSPSPPTAASALFDRVAKSLSVDITNAQLIEMLRDLRSDYSKQALNKGFSIESLNPHEREVFELSRKIWGGEEARVGSNGSMGVSRSGKRRKKGRIAEEKREEETLIGDADLKRGFPILVEEMSRLKDTEAMMGALKLLGRSELERLDKSWRIQQIREAKLMMKKEELVLEAKGLILEAVSRN